MDISSGNEKMNYLFQCPHFSVSSKWKSSHYSEQATDKETSGKFPVLILM